MLANATAVDRRGLYDAAQFHRQHREHARHDVEDQPSDQCHQYDPAKRERRVAGLSFPHYHPAFLRLPLICQHQRQGFAPQIRSRFSPAVADRHAGGQGLAVNLVNRFAKICVCQSVDKQLGVLPARLAGGGDS
ncbi:hypothetical protein D3C76_1356920 [compost metagenome]